MREPPAFAEPQTIVYHEGMSMPTMPYNPPPMPHPPRKPWWKRTWVVATAAGLVGFFLGLPTDSTTADPEPAPTVTATATVTVTAEPEPAPTVTETVTAEPATQPTPTAQPDASEQPADDLGAAVLAAIDNGMPGGRNAWARPITDIETVSSSTARVHYQEALTDDEAQDVGRKVLTFARFTVPQLETVVIRDTSGIDRNVR